MITTPKKLMGIPMVYLLAVAIQVAPTRPAVPNQRLLGPSPAGLAPAMGATAAAGRAAPEQRRGDLATWRHGIGSQKTSGKQ